MNYVNFLLNVFLSPITFLLFFIVTTPFNQYVFTSGAGANISRLIPWTYLLFCAGLLLLGYLLSELYNINAPKKINLVEILQPRFYWLSLCCWLVAGFTLTTYCKGMEGNIMGFIFFPMLLLSSLALLAVNIGPLVSGFDAGGKPLAINIWVAFLLHGCAPLLVLLFHTQGMKEGNAAYDGVMAKLFGVYFFYVFIIGLNWLLFLFSKNSFSFAAFWGVGQSLTYFLPFIGGALVYGYFGFALNEKLPQGIVNNTAYVAFFLVVMASVSLQCINYLQYLKREW